MSRWLHRIQYGVAILVLLFGMLLAFGAFVQGNVAAGLVILLGAVLAGFAVAAPIRLRSLLPIRSNLAALTVLALAPIVVFLAGIAMIPTRPEAAIPSPKPTMAPPAAVAPTQPPVPTVAPPIAAAPTPTAPPAKPTSAPPPPTAVPTPAPTPIPSVAPTLRPPTQTPRPSAKVAKFSGQFQPSPARVGGRLTFALTIENKGDRPIEGVRVFTSGPWDKVTVLAVQPDGTVEPGLLGTNIRSRVVIPPGETQMVNVVVSPNEPGNHRFSFQLNELETGQIVGEDGQRPGIEGTIPVTR